MAEPSLGGDSEPPLAVDLDGTLHAGDLASICTGRLVSSRPWLIPSLLIQACRGRLNLKIWLSERVRLDMSRLRWNAGLITFIKKESDRGRRVFLATAAVEPLAHAAAKHLGSEHGIAVSEVLCSTKEINLLGQAKVHSIVKAADDPVFDYVGDSPTQDPPVFDRARICHFVDPTKKMLADHATSESKVFYTKDDQSRGLVRRLISLAQARPRR